MGAAVPAVTTASPIPAALAVSTPKVMVIGCFKISKIKHYSGTGEETAATLLISTSLALFNLKGHIIIQYIKTYIFVQQKEFTKGVVKTEERGKVASNLYKMFQAVLQVVFQAMLQAVVSTCCDSYVTVFETSKHFNLRMVATQKYRESKMASN